MGGEKVQPRAGDLNKLASEIKSGKKTWNDIFPGVASLELTTNGFGPSLDLRIDKKEGIPIRLVPEGTPGAAVVAVKRVNELGFYTLGRDQLAAKLGISRPKTTAAIWFADVKNDSESYRQITIGKSKFDRYSQKAFNQLQDCIQQNSLDDIWSKYKKEA